MIELVLYTGGPLLLIVLGAIVNQRAGNLNLGIEGTVAVSATTAYIAAYLFQNPWAGLFAGLVAGTMFNMAFSLLSVSLTLNQIVVGIALIFVGNGLASIMGKPYVGAALPFPPPKEVLLAVPAASIPIMLMYRTRVGLAIKASGDNPYAAELMGVSVPAVRHLATFIEGVMAGLGGAMYTVLYTGYLSDGITRGIGILSVSIAMLSMWSPLVALPMTYTFTVLVVLPYALQLEVPVSRYLLNALPYIGVVALLSLASVLTKRQVAPKYLARTYRREEKGL